MATDISSEEDIATRGRIKKLLIDEIEHRARPGKCATSGFLGKDESFKEGMHKDWKNVSGIQVLKVIFASMDFMRAVTKRICIASTPSDLSQCSPEEPKLNS